MYPYSRHMISSIVRSVYHSLPKSVAKIGLWVYSNTFVPIFASGKKTYYFGDFKMRLDQNESTIMVSRRFRDYEPEMSELISQNISSGDTYIDIGSCKGYHVLEAASIVGHEGSVYSFEPEPDNFSDLQENIRLNGFENIKAYNKAVSDEIGTTQFSVGEKSGHNKISQDGDIKVETVTFDEFLNEEDIRLSDIKFVKIDVQGGEKSVLAGMTEFLSESDGCTIIIEIHGNPGIQRMNEILYETKCDVEKYDECWIVTT